MLRVIVSTIAVFAAMASHSAFAVQDYTRRTLPYAFDGYSSHAEGINDVGQIVGQYHDAQGGHGIVWNPDNTIVDLGLKARAFYVNNQGAIAGDFFGTDGHHACVWDAQGNRTDLGLGTAYSVNSSGIAAGMALPGGPSGSQWAAVWDDRGSRTLLSYGNAAYDINDDGMVVGVGRWQTGAYWYAHALRWMPPSFVLQDDGRGPDSEGASYEAVNSLGMAVGSYHTTDDKSRLFGDDRLQLPNLLGEANDVNDSGTVVGTLWDGDAFVWTQEAGLVRLGPGRARAVNSAGVIVGYDGSGRACVWTPIPEPSSIIALLCGVAGLGGMVWRRARQGQRHPPA